MKKIAMIVVAAMFALMMVGCASGNTPSAESAEASDSASSSAEPVVVQGTIAWSDSENADAAAKDAGLKTGFTLPNPLPIGQYKWSEPSFTSMEKVVQAHYDGEVVSVSIRKGEGVPLEELSADKNDYKADWTQEVGDIKVTCHGYEKDIANFLEWEKDGCSYDVWCMSTKEGNIGMSKDEVTAVVKGVK